MGSADQEAAAGQAAARLPGRWPPAWLRCGLALATGAAGAAVLEARAVAVMSHRNRRASEAMVAAGASAATDVTGYGLLGHLRNLRVGADVRLAGVPLLDGMRDLASADLFPGGTRRNHEAVRGAPYQPAHVGEVTDGPIRIRP